MTEYKKPDKNSIVEILDKISNVKAALLGDICLDVYWEADMRETVAYYATFPLSVNDILCS